jgi:anti-sigma factor RsiW
MSAAYPEFTCRELVELVTDYLEGKLARDDRTRFEMHLCYCDGCHTYLDQIRAVKQAAGRVAESAIDPGARDALLAAFRDWKRGAGGGTT